MKNGRFILPEKLQGKQGRTLLAVGSAFWPWC